MKSTILMILVVFTVFTNLLAWDINTDRAAVRAILDSNGLQDVPIGDFSHEGSLGRIIHLSHNGDWVWSTPRRNAKLVKIPAEIGNLTELQELDLLNNSITTISDSIRNCKKLQRFDVSSNLLESLPQINFRTVNLGWFKIYNNRLKVLSDSVSNLLPYLPGDTLRLNNNLLTAIPASISRLTSLVSICADHNLLDSLPSSIGTLPNLQWLQIDNNHIASLPKTLGSQTTWLTVKADHNIITTIPAEYINSHVAFMMVDYNRICSRNTSYNWLMSNGLLSADYQDCTRIESQPSSPLELFSVYPNPFSGTTFIKTNSLINIYDISGRLVFQTSKNMLWKAIPGIYILENNNVFKKIISVR